MSRRRREARRRDSIVAAPIAHGRPATVGGALRAALVLAPCKPGISAARSCSYVSTVLIRRATATDATLLSGLIMACVRESYPGHLGSTPDQLRRDVLTDPPAHHVLLAEVERVPVGFIAWDRIYDMHWAASGAQISDLYVVPAQRGLGVALALVAAAAAEVHRGGGQFLRGGAYDRESTRRAYARVAVVQPSGETNLGGRALRKLAELAGRRPRDILRDLPPVDWNFEA